MIGSLRAGGPVNGQIEATDGCQHPFGGCIGGRLYFRQRDLLTLRTMRAMFYYASLGRITEIHAPAESCPSLQ
jgi:hypothetical protein